MALPQTGRGQATINLTHSEVTRPMAITLGVDMEQFTGSDVEAANRIFQSFADNLCPALDNQMTLTGVDLYIGAGLQPSGSVTSDLSPVVCGAPFVGPVLNTAVIVTKVTASLGRRGKGRFFLPGAIPEGKVSEGGIVDADILGTLQTSLDAFLNDIQDPLAPDGGMNVGVNGIGGGGDGLLFYEVSRLRAEPKVGTQRRRIR